MEKTPLHLALLNDLARCHIEASEDFEDAFIITLRDSQWPFATVYRSPDGSFTVFDAVNDIMQGVALADEKEYARGQTIGGAVTRVRELQARIEPQRGESNYFGFAERDAAYRAGTHD